AAKQLLYPFYRCEAATLSILSLRSSYFIHFIAAKQLLYLHIITSCLSSIDGSIKRTILKQIILKRIEKNGSIIVTAGQTHTVTPGDVTNC
ncbi:MAG: hypothetical protein LBD52_03775, partial [Prevotellaceae bacterium]|nr:hypothetical protein [Prevotellaceae bacterium]